MANWSSFTINLSGDRAALEDTRKRLAPFTAPEPVGGVFFNSHADIASDSYALLNNLLFCDDTLVLLGQGRWNGPAVWFAGVCERFALDGTYTDVEQGNGLFRHIVFAGGHEVSDVSSDFVSAESIIVLGLDALFRSHWWVDADTIDDAVASFVAAGVDEPVAREGLGWDEIVEAA